jgi:ppGpp synthetase/RelA/SpoT-type nucleotidyltranferase
MINTTHTLDLEAAYQARYPILKRVASEIAAALREILDDTPRIDLISVRAKSVARFLEKAQRRDWLDPLHDIQDQIGARVVVYYKQDVETTTRTILAHIAAIEDRQPEATDPRIFGYQAKHYVCYVPRAVQVRIESPVDFFELQVCTLFQHAWAEAEHDLGYAAHTPLDYEERRKIAWAAAQAWGADEIFDDIWRSHYSGAHPNSPTG